jgi:hypothetical protein
VEEEHLKPFGLRVHDLVRSPVGVVGAVIGVKYSSPQDAEVCTGAPGPRCCSMLRLVTMHASSYAGSFSQLFHALVAVLSASAQP